MKTAFIDQAIQNVAEMFRGRLTRNIGWLTGAELVSRFGRVFAAIVLARQLDAVAFGVAAIAVTVFELVRVFTENGIGAAVVRARADEFHRVANTAYKLMWWVCIGLAIIQLVIAVIVEWLMPGRGLGWMIGALSGVFLIMPFGLVHAYCLAREQRMKRLAAVGSSQAVADHLLTAILALTGVGAWAIVLPKLLTTPIWLIGVRIGSPWKRVHSVGSASSSEILKFSIPVLGAELLNAFRDQLDKVVVSLTLGVEALGVYYFAFNAGLGVSSALNRAFSNAIYPHLCAASNRIVSMKRALVTMGAPLGAVYFVQAGAALLYVPVVFGQDWAHAAPLVAILCLGGPARLLLDGIRMYFRSNGASGRELFLTLGFTTSVLVPFAAASSWGLIVAASVSTASAWVFGAATAGVFFARLRASNHVVQGVVS